MAVANATASSGLLTLERELQCFICTELLFQPLTLIDCLHTFCGACLKEWFGHQHKKASSSRSSSTSNPYTCPTCRATVKDARHNATVTTLLDMFLTANPSRGRTKEEEAEQLEIYKPGDEILPKVEPRRRKEGRSRREEEDTEAQDRRLLEETRQRSLRDLENQEPRSRLNAPSIAAPRSTSRGHEERRTRRREQERAERRRRVEAAEEANARERGGEAAGITETVLPPQSSPRHPAAVEARQRDSTIAHQPSLISLMSASESSTGTGDSLNEARIMQEILAEGLLEGINVDELTELEQDELSERIAEAYRQRHQRTGQVSPPQPTGIINGIPPHLSSRNTAAREDPAEENAARRQARSHSHQPSSTGSSRSREVSTDAGRPPASRPHLLDVADISGSARSSAHRRRASDQSRRQTSPLRTPRANPTERNGTPATRSATEFSDAPSSDRGSPRSRPRQLSDNRRTNTEPQTATRVSDLWQQCGRESSPAETAESTAAELPVCLLSREATDPSPPKDATMVQQRAVTLDSIPQIVDRAQSASTNTSPQESQNSPLRVLTRFQEPSISCARCSRQEIHYDLYKHCKTCKMDLCLRCYRTSRGCDHWFGFGKKAQTNFFASQSGLTSQVMDPPHVLVGRKYLEAPPGTIQAPGVPLRSTTSNPAERLQEGHFCDRCHAFANACFWSCDYCNEGEWGFCNDCVNMHKCCVHPLLPLAHRSFAPKSPSSQDQAGYDPHMSNITMTPTDLHAAIVTTPTQSRPSAAGSGTKFSHHDEHPDYVNLSFKTDCDICNTAIDPADPRYHCPYHPSPTSQNPQKAGDYDICMPCYHQLVDTGKIKRDDGPAGWRKCPAGHRMIIVAFEEDAYMHQRRIVQGDLVGGHLLDPKETIGPRSRTGSMNASGSRFPPIGGSGKTYAAMWSYYPEEGTEGSGELMFPKWAEIRECEDQNEDWAYGVYMGNRGLVPRAYVREWQG